MPELPEVERARRLVDDNLLGTTIVDAEAYPDDLVFVHPTTPSGFVSSLKNKRIVATHRRGKLFFIELDQPPHPVFHFGMTGSIQIRGLAPPTFMDFKTDATNWPPRFVKLVLKTSNHLELAFTDPRRLARVRVLMDPLREPPISELGFDPVHSFPDLEDFAHILRARSGAVKGVLLDQSFCAGIGNWIADEVLFQAHIHPSQGCRTLTDNEIQILHSKIKYVIDTALAVNADSDRFPADWMFHYRWSKGKKTQPKMPDGRWITFETVGGRTSAIVKAVQKLRAGTSTVSTKKRQVLADSGGDTLTVSEERTKASAVSEAEQPEDRESPRKLPKMQATASSRETETESKTTPTKRFKSDLDSEPNGARRSRPSRHQEDLSAVVKAQHESRRITRSKSRGSS
ncbi:DNA glycosylase/AP lyase [Polychytrium aggregatum]|uniref:DNA glycosylase/AP lyase n=1 Tax=Polychytrium aggregatum TaxID=110093 RepID=UPI0022FEC539|nr:DNA glycosylase/AP lyase [Polychytrium aggregatum]KAI9193359.1 DNA glycosylase/AP lyase [Polychytrium aggregatum]